MQLIYGLSAVCQALLFTEVSRVEQALCGQAGEHAVCRALGSGAVQSDSASSNCSVNVISDHIRTHIHLSNLSSNIASSVKPP